VPRTGVPLVLCSPSNNNVEFGGYDLVVTATGVLQLTARWTGRSFGNGTWFEAGFAYITS
jgi:hypothetical protein